jgi:hypothetical protein
MRSRFSSKFFLAIYLFILAPVIGQADTESKKTSGLKREIFSSFIQNQHSLSSCIGIKVPSSHAVSFHKRKHGRCKKNRVNWITQHDFRGKGKNGIIIDQPGEYRLKENISFKPTRPNVQAITITASNVVLDLDIFTLSQNLTNSKTGIYGIAIARDVQNVKITGSKGVAQILDFTLAGIRVLGRTDHITLENVIVTQTTPTLLTNDVIPQSCADLNCALITGGIYVGEGEPVGLAFKGTNKNNHVTNLVINHVNAERCMFGSQIVMTFGIQIDNSSFIENTSNGLLLGFFLPIAGDLPNTFEFPVAADGTIRHCHFDRNVGDTAGIVNPTEGNVAFLFQLMGAIVLNEVQNFTIENCSVDDNAGTAALLACDHDGAHNINWKNCTFNRNQSLMTCHGFHFSGSIPFLAGECVGIGEQTLQQDIDVVVENCTAENNQSSTEDAVGFLLSFVNGARVADCNASGNFALSIEDVASSASSGFDVLGELPGGNSNAITFLRCTAEGNGNNGFQATAAGFTVHSATSNIIFRDCVAVANGNTSGTVLNTGAGFFINAPTMDVNAITQNVTIDHCIANSNGFLDQLGPSGGIVIEATLIGLFIPTVNNVLIQNCTLAYNQNGLIVPFDITGLVVKHNEADQNTLVGFDVTNVISPSFVTKNVAYSNFVENYAGVPPENIVTATVANLPDGTAVGFKNLSVIP